MWYNFALHANLEKMHRCTYVLMEHHALGTGHVWMINMLLQLRLINYY